MTGRVTEARLPELGRAVCEVAAELTTALGGVMPEAKSALAGFAVGRDPSEGI
jgi:IclR family acetate operon transcriptional repressor